mmetsp:Transcript_10227/g.27835  ORF Transcript_10227/g.27835 Transcript_10227/m.27835 type:complete len:237 (-) Transcript_10227:842-1552(-)
MATWMCPARSPGWCSEAPPCAAAPPHPSNPWVAALVVALVSFLVHTSSPSYEVTRTALPAGENLIALERPLQRHWTRRVASARRCTPTRRGGRGSRFKVMPFAAACPVSSSRASASTLSRQTGPRVRDIAPESMRSKSSMSPTMFSRISEHRSMAASALAGCAASMRVWPGQARSCLVRAEIVRSGLRMSCITTRTRLDRALVAAVASDAHTRCWISSALASSQPWTARCTDWSKW